MLKMMRRNENPGSHRRRIRQEDHTFPNDGATYNHSNCIDTPESERHVTKRAGMATACTTTGRERPALIPPSQDWFYLGPWDMPQVRQVEPTQTLPTTITLP